MCVTLSKEHFWPLLERMPLQHWMLVIYIMLCLGSKTWVHGGRYRNELARFKSLFAIMSPNTVSFQCLSVLGI